MWKRLEVHLHGREQAHRDVDVVRDTGEVVVELVFIARIRTSSAGRAADSQRRSTRRGVRSRRAGRGYRRSRARGSADAPCASSTQISMEPRVFLGGRAAFRRPPARPRSRARCCGARRGGSRARSGPQIRVKLGMMTLQTPRQLSAGPLLCFRTRILHRTSAGTPKEYCLTKWGCQRRVPRPAPRQCYDPWRPHERSPSTTRSAGRLDDGHRQVRESPAQLDQRRASSGPVRSSSRPMPADSCRSAGRRCARCCGSWRRERLIAR